MHLFQHSKSRGYSRLRNKILLLLLFCWPWVVVREASWMPMLHADKALKDREIGKSSTDKKNTQRQPFPFQIYQHWDMKKSWVVHCMFIQWLAVSYINNCCYLAQTHPPYLAQMISFSLWGKKEIQYSAISFKHKCYYLSWKKVRVSHHLFFWTPQSLL